MCPSPPPPQLSTTPSLHTPCEFSPLTSSTIATITTNPTSLIRNFPNTKSTCVLASPVSPRPSAPRSGSWAPPASASSPPLYMIMPGADERLAKQTTKWAPRWEKNISYFAPPVERGVQRIEPPVSRVVQRIEERLPLEKMAKGVDSKIKAGIERFSPKPKE
ncbi:hypothetical protein NLG97_g10027 [Lecanicillium saksenae]|uniref:Uncharacterized protein n=1 Tax=Lecanicillium saksenae TaxID=468837 RepID=A0ACC1QH33_9HYPO|nr:hypothetical protein NLG97_g10027 [Lecanicillium saksenae]